MCMFDHDNSKYGMSRFTRLIFNEREPINFSIALATITEGGYEFTFNFSFDENRKSNFVGDIKKIHTRYEAKFFAQRNRITKKNIQKILIL